MKKFCYPSLSFIFSIIFQPSALSHTPSAMCHHPPIRPEPYHSELKTLLLSSKLYFLWSSYLRSFYRNRQKRKIFGSYILGRVVMSDCTLSSQTTQCLQFSGKESLIKPQGYQSCSRRKWFQNLTNKVFKVSPLKYIQYGAFSSYELVHFRTLRNS